EGDRLGLATRDGAEAAGAGADVAQDHERRGAPGPALRAVRAAGALADRLEAELGDQGLGEVRAPGRGDRPLEPVREAPLGRRGAAAGEWRALRPPRPRRPAPAMSATLRA